MNLAIAGPEDIVSMTQANDRFQELIRVVSETCDVAGCHKILDSGLDINSSTSAGCTALMFAAMPNDYGDHNSPQAIWDVVNALLARGADPAFVDSFGMTAADYARQLLDPNWKDRFGVSAAACWDSAEKRTIRRIIALLENAS